MEICQTNIGLMWPYLLLSVKNADFIAMDLELSGLGPKSANSAKNVSDRYAALREAATTRGILSFGLAFFKRSENSEVKRCLPFDCQVFNILSLCCEPFTVEPEALEFLSKHSFDFNRLIETGIRYYPSKSPKECALRSLTKEILSRGVPLFLHNGLIDLVFFYHHFYSPLPESFGEFSNALADLFPPESPVYDSKYLADYRTRMSASFLEYVFRRCQGDNVRESLVARWYLRISFDDCTAAMASLGRACETVNCRLPTDFPDHALPSDLSDKICGDFANHGFCRKQGKDECRLLHDVDSAIDLDYLRKRRNRLKRKKRYDYLKPDSIPEKESVEGQNGTVRGKNSLEEMKMGIAVSGCHRAGVDAFMTGYAILFQNRIALWIQRPFIKLDPESRNRIPLSGKQQPFTIQSTQFSGACPEHKSRFAAIHVARKNNTNFTSSVHSV
ncbi:hypothetical protein Q1695_013646 [Nippostrongylus brasiliensis]|nr:hypothetical protein Q1695_013646 [Nippostrongylus brasiliensis]